MCGVSKSCLANVPVIPACLPVSINPNRVGLLSACVKESEHEVWHWCQDWDMNQVQGFLRWNRWSRHKMTTQYLLNQECHSLFVSLRGYQHLCVWSKTALTSQRIRVLDCWQSKRCPVIEDTTWKSRELRSHVKRTTCSNYNICSSHLADWVIFLVGEKVTFVVLLTPDDCPR